ncbi:hypothetical protein TNCV_1171951 [Trichonephila clavipes]|uniref:Transposase n=1 Tax=Trichonephila clavipes TaxID=2585209 RepID=A0A8X6S2F2_TRICX|nr:hypothetical protein TNCV_1171951 [Trichonephila clavipes]
MIRTIPPLISTEEGFTSLKFHQIIALNYIKRLGFVCKLSVRVPHELNERNLMDRISICSSNLARHKKEPFLENSVTTDEKWIVYINTWMGIKAYVYKGETLTPPSEVGVYQKVMLCCWRDRARRFVEWAQKEIAVVPDFHKRILFSDEAHFWLNGYVNKQNCRIWSEANPQVYVETPLHPEKLTVWCALWAGGILLQKR